MKRFLITGSAALAFAVAACGGGDAGAEEGGEAAEAAPAPAPATPAAAAPAAAPSSVDWVVVDDGARTVTIQLVAGQTDANNYWNYNGHSNGDATLVVPEGYEVTIDFLNEDPVNVHSVAVLEAMGTYPALFENPSPVFEGAISSNPTSMTEATAAGGGTETVTFTASTAGQYALVCTIPAHAVTGMWIGFEVSASGQSGLRM